MPRAARLPDPRRPARLRHRHRPRRGAAAGRGATATARLPSRATTQRCATRWPACGPQAVFDQGLNASLADRLLAGQLPQRTVTLVVLPGVPAATVSATTAGAGVGRRQVTVVARLDDDLIDPGKKTYVDSVVSASIEGAPDLAKKADHSTYSQAGALAGAGLHRPRLGLGDR